MVVPVSTLRPITYHPAASVSRLVAYARNVRALAVTLVIACDPLLMTLVGRNFVELTAIPSASMDPTLQRGDVLLVEKLPAVYNRVHRGDIVLFRPTQSLQDIIRNSGGGTISPNQLFVKRLVGIPGDTDIFVDTGLSPSTADQTVTIHG